MSSLPPETPPERPPELPERPRHSPWEIGPLTVALIVFSVAATWYANFGKNLEVMRHAAISEFDGAAYGIVLPEVHQGQVWRLITPIFIHFSTVRLALDAIHFAFNLFWLKDLGTAIERIAGTRTLFALLIVIGAVGNLAQYLVFGPEFGGMSAVIYGLFGYVWMMAKLAPQSGFIMPWPTVYSLVGWLGFCMTGLLGPFANFAHAIGVALGIVCGYFSAKTLPAAAAPAETTAG